MVSILSYDITINLNKGILLENMPAIAIYGLPEFMAVMTFSIEGIGMVLPLKNSMESQTGATSFFVKITVFVCFLYLVFGSITAMKV